MNFFREGRKRGREGGRKMLIIEIAQNKINKKKIKANYPQD